MRIYAVALRAGSAGQFSGPVQRASSAGQFSGPVQRASSAGQFSGLGLQFMKRAPERSRLVSQPGRWLLSLQGRYGAGARNGLAPRR